MSAVNATVNTLSHMAGTSEDFSETHYRYNVVFFKVLGVGHFSAVVTRTGFHSSVRHFVPNIFP